MTNSTQHISYSICHLLGTVTTLGLDSDCIVTVENCWQHGDYIGIGSSVNVLHLSTVTTLSLSSHSVVTVSSRWLMEGTSIQPTATDNHDNGGAFWIIKAFRGRVTGHICLDLNFWQNFIGLHVILKLQIKEFKACLNQIHKIILTDNPLRCSLAPLLKEF